jgi:hypothetical protein
VVTYKYIYIYIYYVSGFDSRLTERVSIEVTISIRTGDVWLLIPAETAVVLTEGVPEFPQGKDRLVRLTEPKPYLHIRLNTNLCYNSLCNPILFAICTSTFSKLCINVYSGM